VINNNIDNVMYTVLILLTTLFFSNTLLAKLSIEPDKATKQIIQKRIAPIGKVCLPSEECAATARSFAQIDSKGKNRTGEEVYTAACAACHSNGLLNAPIKGDKETWLSKLEVAGSFDKLLKNAINGVGAMPPKGTCLDCSTDEIAKAISFMSDIEPSK